MTRILIAVIVLCLASCTNYIKVIHTDPVPDAENTTRKIFFKEGTLDLRFYGDYIFDKVDKKHIFFTNKNISEILNNFNVKPDEQVLFTYTPNSIYNNMLGFYYAGKNLEDVKTKFFIKTPEKEIQNGLQYIYLYKGYNIIEVYKQEGKGVFRFISINNPARQSVDKFKLENDKVFFEINARLWAGQ